MVLSDGGYTRRITRVVVTDDTPVIAATWPVSLRSALFTRVTLSGRRLDVEGAGYSSEYVGYMLRHTDDAADLLAGVAYQTDYASINGGWAGVVGLGNDGTGDLNECRLTITSIAAQTWDVTCVIEIQEARDPT